MTREVILSKTDNFSFPVAWLEGREKTVVFRRFIPTNGTPYNKPRVEETFFDCINWSREKEVSYWDSYEWKEKVEQNIILMEIERYDRVNNKPWRLHAHCQIIVKSIKPTKHIIWI